MRQNIFILAIAITAILASACEIEMQEKELAKKISTRAGELALRYENGQTTLSGTLQRSTPCVNWAVQTGGTNDLPRSEITIKIFNSNKDAICIQMLGEPQEISEKIEGVSENTEYTVSLEEDIIFSGKLDGKVEK